MWFPEARAEGRCGGRRTLNPQVVIPHEKLAAFCRKHGIVRLAVFGSALRDDFGPDSDIDVLVDFDRSRRPTLLDAAGIEIGLGEMLGRNVDMLTRSSVERGRNPIRRRLILESAEAVYAA